MDDPGIDFCQGKRFLYSPKVQNASEVPPFPYSVGDHVTFEPDFHDEYRENTGIVLYFHKEKSHGFYTKK